MINFYEYYNDRSILSRYTELSGFFTICQSNSWIRYTKKQLKPYVSIIKKNSRLSYKYAKDILKCRWSDGEPIIKTSPRCSYLYAAFIIKGRWLEAEPRIMSDPLHALWYTRDVMKCRWIEAEPIIATDGIITEWYNRTFGTDR